MKKYLSNIEYVKLNEELNALALEKEKAEKDYSAARDRLNRYYEGIYDIEISINSLEMKHCFTKKKKNQRTSMLEELKKVLERKRQEIFNIQDELATLIFKYMTISTEYIAKERELQEKYLAKNKIKALVKPNN